MFIEIEVKTAIIVHGYDTNNQEIIEELNEEDFMRKIVSVDRIQSISENYILVSSSHERVMYWEYKGSMEEIKQRILKTGISIA